MRRALSALDVSFSAACVRAHPAMQPLLQRALAPGAAGSDQVEFARLWQERVRRILIDHRDDPRLLRIERAV